MSCDEIVSPEGGLCGNRDWRDGKCALHWGNSAAVRRPGVRTDAPGTPRRHRRREGSQAGTPAGVERATSSDGTRRGGRPVTPPPTGMEAVWEQCRRWDRLYDATLRRQDDHEGRA